MGNPLPRFAFTADGLDLVWSGEEWVSSGNILGVGMRVLILMAVLISTARQVLELSYYPY